MNFRISLTLHSNHRQTKNFISRHPITTVQHVSHLLVNSSSRSLASSLDKNGTSGGEKSRRWTPVRHVFSGGTRAPAPWDVDGHHWWAAGVSDPGLVATPPQVRVGWSVRDLNLFSKRPAGFPLCGWVAVAHGRITKDAACGSAHPMTLCQGRSRTASKEGPRPPPYLKSRAPTIGSNPAKPPRTRKKLRRESILQPACVKQQTTQLTFIQT